MEEEKVDIRFRIKQRMQELGYSFYDLAEKTGIPHSALWRYANGHTDKIPIDRVAIIAKALEVDSEYLLVWNLPPTKVNPLDEQIKDIVFACSNDGENLTDDQKQDIIDIYKLVQSKKKRE